MGISPCGISPSYASLRCTETDARKRWSVVIYGGAGGTVSKDSVVLHVRHGVSILEEARWSHSDRELNVVCWFSFLEEERMFAK